MTAKTITLQECCDILDSRRVPVTASQRKSGIYPYFGANGVQDYVDGYIFDDELVLLAEDGGNFGSKDKPIAYRVSGKCWVNNHAHVLKPKDGIDVDYLCYALMFYDVSTLVNGSTRQKLNQSAIRKMRIPLLPYLEQRHIAATLDAVTEIIKLRKSQLAELDLLVKSRFVEMFGDESKWPIKQLGNLCELKAGKFISASKIKADYSEELFPCYGGNGLRGYVETYSHEGDFPLIGRQGALCGNVQFAKGKFYATEHAVVTRPKTAIDALWLCFILKEKDLNQLSSGAAQPGLTVEKLTQVEIPLPPLDLQNRFAAFAEAADKSKFSIRQAIDETQTLRDSLMSEYFE